MKLKNINAATQLVQIARLSLRADIALASGRADQAVPLLREATRVEDELAYDEPHLWLGPTRHALGDALLAASRPRDAERVFREDLAHYPGNGWSLTGLAVALKKQGRQEAARETERSARAAFAGAEALPRGARF